MPDAVKFWGYPMRAPSRLNRKSGEKGTRKYGRKTLFAGLAWTVPYKYMACGSVENLRGEMLFPKIRLEDLSVA